MTNNANSWGRPSDIEIRSMLLDLINQKNLRMQSRLEQYNKRIIYKQLISFFQFEDIDLIRSLVVIIAFTDDDHSKLLRKLTKGTDIPLLVKSSGMTLADYVDNRWMEVPTLLLNQIGQILQELRRKLKLEGANYLELTARLDQFFTDEP
jgi:hypothetical protein